MSPHGHLFAHATDWMASAAECAMDTCALHMLLGDSRMLHDR